MKHLSVIMLTIIYIVCTIIIETYKSTSLVVEFGTNTIYNQLTWLYSISHFILIGVIILMYAKELKSIIKKLFPLMILLFLGCRPYDVPEFVEFQSNQTAFIVPMNNLSEEEKSNIDPEFLKRNLAVGRVQIPHEWVQTGRMWWNGKYIDTHRVLIVDRSPVTRQWTANNATGTSTTNQSIWAESKDSVGFSTGFSVSAMICDNDDAIRFLQFYPPTLQDKADYTLSTSSLTEVIDNELRARIQKIYAREAATVNMDLLREQKNEIMDKIEDDVVPFFEERGITITTIGQFGGFTYENPDIQKSIDAVFQAQQDEEVAKAEFAAAEQRKLALKSEGEGEAAKILEAKKGEAQAVLEVAKAEADAIKQKAEARAQEVSLFTDNPEAYIELRKLEIELERMKQWDGKYPQTILGESNILFGVSQ